MHLHSENLWIKKITPPYLRTYSSIAPCQAPLGEAPLGMRHVFRKHPTHKSSAGGDVILRGFASALVAAIYCYIRITRKKPASETTPWKAHHHHQWPYHTSGNFPPYPRSPPVTSSHQRHRRPRVVAVTLRLYLHRKRNPS
ncbi:hypothetical protein LIER_38637 [Lithospermum erythrorhizon]|uniref:Uncharacterized protein n=1 Tax=Lithospermum erythrorhizon TaxID=34254 RepID=A0AAV3Q859_LITER